MSVIIRGNSGGNINSKNEISAILSKDLRLEQYVDADTILLSSNITNISAKLDGNKVISGGSVTLENPSSIMNNKSNIVRSTAKYTTKLSSPSLVCSTPSHSPIGKVYVEKENKFYSLNKLYKNGVFELFIYSFDLDTEVFTKLVNVPNGKITDNMYSVSLINRDNRYIHIIYNDIAHYRYDIVNNTISECTVMSSINYESNSNIMSNTCKCDNNSYYVAYCASDRDGNTVSSEPSKNHIIVIKKYSINNNAWSLISYIYISDTLYGGSYFINWVRWFFIKNDMVYLIYYNNYSNNSNCQLGKYKLNSGTSSTVQKKLSISGGDCYKINNHDNDDNIFINTSSSNNYVSLLNLESLSIVDFASTWVSSPYYDYYDLVYMPKTSEFVRYCHASPYLYRIVLDFDVSLYLRLGWSVNDEDLQLDGINTVIYDMNKSVYPIIKG